MMEPDAEPAPPLRPGSLKRKRDEDNDGELLLSKRRKLMANAPDDFPLLEVVEGEGTGTLGVKVVNSNMAQSGGVFIGRSRKAAIAASFPKDMEMSATHAVIKCTEGTSPAPSFVIADCNSTNGTYVNDVKLRDSEKRILHNGDRIVCGNTKIVWVPPAPSSRPSTQQPLSSNTTTVMGPIGSSNVNSYGNGNAPRQAQPAFARDALYPMRSAQNDENDGLRGNRHSSTLGPQEGGGGRLCPKTPSHAHFTRIKKNFIGGSNMSAIKNTLTPDSYNNYMATRDRLNTEIVTMERRGGESGNGPSVSFVEDAGNDSNGPSSSNNDSSKAGGGDDDEEEVRGMSLDFETATAPSPSTTAERVNTQWYEELLEKTEERTYETSIYFRSIEMQERVQAMVGCMRGTCDNFLPVIKGAMSNTMEWGRCVKNGGYQRCLNYVTKLGDVAGSVMGSEAVQSTLNKLSSTMASILDSAGKHQEALSRYMKYGAGVLLMLLMLALVPYLWSPASPGLLNHSDGSATAASFIPVQRDPSNSASDVVNNLQQSVDEMGAIIETLELQLLEERYMQLLMQYQFVKFDHQLVEDSMEEVDQPPVLPNEDALKDLAFQLTMEEIHHHLEHSQEPDAAQTISADSLKDFMFNALDTLKNGPRLDHAQYANGGRILRESDGYLIYGMRASANMGYMSLEHPYNFPTNLELNHCWMLPATTNQTIVFGFKARPQCMHVNGVTIEHPSHKVVTDAFVGFTPREFAVDGYDGTSNRWVSLTSTSADSSNPHLEYTFPSKDQTQTFNIGPEGEGDKTPCFSKVRVRMLSNYGSEEGTCIHRIRLHGWN